MAVVAANAVSIAAAAKALRAGTLVAFPTETVYGLGADATNGLAVARIFEAKGRPRFNPLIVHVPSLEHAGLLSHITPLALQLAQAFWPGPLTLVLQKRAAGGLSDLVTAGLDTVAIRVPDHPLAKALLVETGRPLAAPSANRSGHVSATQARHVDADLSDRVALVLDGGATAHGIESTILDATGNGAVLLRSGAVPADTIEAVLGQELTRHLEAGNKPNAPGQLASHYAPLARVRLNATSSEPGEAVLAFGPVPLKADGPAFNLSPSGDLIEAASNLFAALRVLDAARPASIAVMPIPEFGLGEAINDRLRRAAAPRP
jgi:L-threonylcarbamoyladenylate synthase